MTLRIQQQPQVLGVTVGGQIHQQLSAWQGLLLNWEINNILKEGFQIPFVKDPPTMPFPLHDPVLAEEDMKVLDQEVSTLLNKGSIELATSPSFSSHLFCIPKKTGELWPVLNLQPQNTFIAPRHFKMESLKVVTASLEKGNYLTSLNLQDAFHHILIHPKSHKYLQFHWHGKIYQFKVLPFGLSLAPFVFTKVLCPILCWAWAQGIQLYAYLDDLLIAAHLREQSIKDTVWVQHKLQELRFLINMSKSHTTPMQVLQHLGFIINMKDMMLSVPGDKIRDICHEASKMIHKGMVTLWQILSFIGKTNAMMAAIFLACLHSQHLLQLKNRSQAMGLGWGDMVQITAEAVDDLTWWQRGLQTWNGQCWIPPQMALNVYMDALDKGWGIVIRNHSWSGLWSMPQ